MNHLSIQIENLRFRNSGVTLPKQIKLEISGGEVALILGPTGSGKSTILNCLNGLVPKLMEAEYQGGIKWNGNDLHHNSDDGPHPVIQTVLQNVYHTHASHFFRNLNNRGSKIEKPSIMENLNEVEVFQDMSAGMKQRAVLQNAFQSKPDLLLLDEPSNHLDEKGRQLLMEMLKTRKNDNRYITIVTDHEYGMYEELVDKKLLLNSDDKPEWLNFSENKPLQFDKYLIPSDTGGNGKLIEFSDVLLKYNTHVVLEHVNLKLNRGEVVGITGENGSGKTTLGRAILGYKKSKSGKISRTSRKIRVSELGETPRFLSDIVVDEIKFPVNNFDLQNEFIPVLAADFKLDSVLNNSISSLSYGTQVRLGLSAAIAGNPDLVVMDEPLQGQDSHGIEMFSIIIRALKEKGKTVVIFSQNTDFINSVSDRQFRIQNHELAALN